jgi:hypothetical protein
LPITFPETFSKILHPSLSQNCCDRVSPHVPCSVRSPLIDEMWIASASAAPREFPVAGDCPRSGGGSFASGGGRRVRENATEQALIFSGPITRDLLDMKSWHRPLGLPLWLIIIAALLFLFAGHAP